MRPTNDSVREVGLARMKGWIGPHRNNRTNCLQPKQMKDDTEAGPFLFLIWKGFSVKQRPRRSGA